MDTGQLRRVDVELPAGPEAIAKLRLGDVVFLSGVVYTAREVVYERVLHKGEDLPEYQRVICPANQASGAAVPPQP